MWTLQWRYHFTLLENSIAVSSLKCFCFLIYIQSHIYLDLSRNTLLIFLSQTTWNLTRNLNCLLTSYSWISLYIYILESMKPVGCSQYICCKSFSLVNLHKYSISFNCFLVFFYFLFLSFFFLGWWQLWRNAYLGIPHFHEFAHYAYKLWERKMFLHSHIS